MLAPGLVALTACSSGGPAPVGRTHQAVLSVNGLSINGLSINGLSINGLSINGLSINGLSINGLSTNTFSAWFNQNLDQAPSLMSYIVKCALPAGNQLSWQNASTGQSYTWTGSLGLAPGWASGKPATEAEQQLISACLGAHINKFGLHISIAVEGRDANGVEIPHPGRELELYSKREGCFFGNLFTGDGVFAGSYAAYQNEHRSSPRACALEDARAELREECPPMLNIGICDDHCTMDGAGVYYKECTFNGKSYRPLTTRLVPDDIYTCGDGVCQFTESCGTGVTYDNCGLDCGPCT